MKQCIKNTESYTFIGYFLTPLRCNFKTYYFRLNLKHAINCPRNHSECGDV